MSNKERLRWILVISGSIVLSLSWFAFHSQQSMAWFGRPSVIAVFLILCILPIYPFLRGRRNLPRLASTSVLLAVGALVTEALYIVGRFLMHTDGEWVIATSKLSKVLLVSSLVVGMWAGYSRRER